MSKKKNQPKAEPNPDAVAETSAEVGTGEEAAVDSGWRRWVPWAIFGLFTLMILAGLRPAKAKGEYDHVAFGKLPVLVGGRIKPMDSVARNALLQIAGQQKIAIEGNGPDGDWGDLMELHDAHDGEGLHHQTFSQKFYKRPKKLHPTEWLMEVLMRPEIADRRFIFRIDLPELLEELKLETTGVDQSGLRYYSFEQLKPLARRLDTQAREIRNGVEDKQQTPYQRAVMKLAGSIHVYLQLRYSLQPNGLVLPGAPPSDEEDLASWHRENQLQILVNRYCQTATADYTKELNRLDEANPLYNSWVEEKAAALQVLSTYLRGEVADSTNRLDQLSITELDALQHEALLSVPSRFEEQIETIQRQLALINLALSEGTADRSRLMQNRQQLLEFRFGLSQLLQEFDSIKNAPVEQQKALVRTLFIDDFIYRVMKDRGHLLIVPPDNPQEKNTGWKKAGEVLHTAVSEGGGVPQPLKLLGRISSSYGAEDSKGFNEAVAGYSAWLTEQKFLTATRKGREEYFFNSFAPFARSMGVYLLAALLAGFSWLNLSKWLSRSAFYLIGLALVVHTVGLIFRMYLEGRPPVTNLYSSAVFCGWGAVLLGWILERIYRNGIGSFTAGVIGFSTLIIARHLAQEGDTMEMMQAVLDTNFWLATHVTSITIGYSATFLAGFLALIYIIRGVFTPKLHKDTASSIARMVYGVVCFATLFSFVGTVLGGIWADQSWGRFWGWDTKENGALLIVLWNVLVLHAKWGGLVKERGLVTLVVFGNVVTAWSWFGVNMLGIGLHSYGFMDAAWVTLKWFAIGQMLFMIVAMQPLHNWLSGKQLAKKGEHKRDIAVITAVMSGVGLVLHFVAPWTYDFFTYLGGALIFAGLVLAYVGGNFTQDNSSSPQKSPA